MGVRGRLTRIGETMDEPKRVERAEKEPGIWPRPYIHLSVGFSFLAATVCIGCKACEVACKQWNQLPADGYELTGDSYDNTKQLSGTTWRHVAFIENPKKKRLTGDVDLVALAEDRCCCSVRR